MDQDRDQVRFGEHLMVVAWRKLVCGHGRCPALTRDLARLPGCQPQDLLRALAIFFGALDNGCRRPLEVAPVGFFPPTCDELRLLAVLGAAQRGETARLEAHLVWLVLPGHRLAVAVAARILAGLLTRAEIAIPTAALKPTDGQGQPLLAMVMP